MALYYGLPFGIYALMIIIQDSSKSSDSFFGRLMFIIQKVFILILVFIGTFVVLYLPFISRSGL